MSAQTVTRKAAPVIKFDPKPKASLVDVTPAQAAKWLELNGKNRPRRQRVVDVYARDMSTGAWQMTGEPVKFGLDGSLLDGQHRLAAVVQSGVTVPMLVIRGLAADSQEVMDSGAKRTAGDALNLRGHTNTMRLSSVARLAIVIEEYGFDAVAGQQRSVSTSEVTAFVAEHPELADCVAWAGTVYRQLDTSPSAIAYAMWRTLKIDADAANDFFADAADGIGLQAGDPVLALRKRLAEARRNRERMPLAGSLSLIFRAWNARREGRSLHRIPVVGRDGSIVIPEPV